MMRNSLLLAIALALAGCQYVPKLDEVLPDKRSEYRKSTTLPDLEVPPDLSTESIQDKMAIPEEGATFSTYQERVTTRKKEREAAGNPEGAVQALTGERVLIVAGDSTAVWDKLHEFWREREFTLYLDDSEYGVQETNWKENQTDLVRDRFKVFVEAGEQTGTTTLYVSHEGQELKPDGEELTWQPRSPDDRIEQRFLDQVKEHFGATDAAAVAAAPGAAPPTAASASAAAKAGTGQAEIVNTGDGKFYLALAAEFSDAWHATSLALPKAGLSVDEADKTRGVYLISLQDGEAAKKKGMLSKLAFWKKGKKQYQLSLTGVGKNTEIVVLDGDGKWDTSETAGQILGSLKDALNKSL